MIRDNLLTKAKSLLVLKQVNLKIEKLLHVKNVMNLFVNFIALFCVKIVKLELLRT
jgi:hypothetical protein